MILRFTEKELILESESARDSQLLRLINNEFLHFICRLGTHLDFGLNTIRIPKHFVRNFIEYVKNDWHGIFKKINLDEFKLAVWLAE